MKKLLFLGLIPLVALVIMLVMATRGADDTDPLVTLGTGPGPKAPVLSPSALMPVPEAATAKPKQFKGQRLLLTEADEDRAFARYADVRRLDLAHKVLLFEEEKLDRRTEANRLVAVNFLIRAIQWERNPRREYAVEKVEEILTARNFEGADVALRQSLAGDKIELFNALLTSDPERAKQLAQSVEGTANGRVLRFAMGWRTILGGHPID